MTAAPNALGSSTAPTTVKGPSQLQKILGSKLVKKIAGTLLEDSAPRIEAALAKVRTKLGGEPLFWLAILKTALSSVANILPGPIGRVAKVAITALTFLVGREVVQPVVTLPAAVKSSPPPPPKTAVDVAKAPVAATKVAVKKVTTSKPASSIKGAVGSALAKLKPKGK